MEPRTSIIGGGDHVLTWVGRYSVHTDMVGFCSQAYYGPPSANHPVTGDRFKAVYNSPEDRIAGHDRIVRYLLKLPQKQAHVIPLWILRDEEHTRFELDGYKAGLRGKRVIGAGDDIPLEHQSAWLAGYRRGRAEQQDRNWNAIRNGLTENQYQRLRVWAGGKEGRALDPLSARFEDCPTPMQWAVNLHEWLGRPDSREIASYYPRYVEAALWRVLIRPRILERDDYECWRCTGGANEVHHASYHPMVMAGIADDWLFSVCRACHEFIHSDDPSYRLQWLRLNNRLTRRGLTRRRWKQRINFGENLPTPEQVALWQAQTAHAEVEAFRRGMERIRQRLETGQDWSLERAVAELRFPL